MLRIKLLPLSLSLSLLIVVSQSFPNPIINPNNTDPCFQFLKNLTNRFIPIANRSLEVNNSLAYSGHNINDLGTYKMCNDKSTQAYSIATVSASGLNGMLGFCAPSYCSTKKLQNYTDNVIQWISNVTGKDASQIASVSFTDPSILGITKGFWFYFTITIFFILGALVVIGTISANTERKVTQKIKRNHPDSLIESGHENLREALLINKESTNQIISKHTYLANGASQESPFKAMKEEEIPIPRKKSLITQIAECFDLRQNITDLFKDEIGPGHDPNLNVVHGIRAFSFGWVVYGHTFSMIMNAKNPFYLTMYIKSPWFLVLLSAFYAVDTFFFLGGFFTGFFMLSKLRKMKLSFQSYGQLFFHRWLRLWPAYFVAILFSWKLSVYMGNGVLWYSYVQQAQSCDDEAWKNWLFMDNVLSVTHECFSWGWYLSNDFQMFLLAPFICWIYLKNRQRSFNVIWVLILISTMAAYNYSANSGIYYILEMFTGGGGDYGKYMTDYYHNPIVRMSPYLLGLYLGFIFKEFKQGKKNFFSWLQESNFRSAVSAIIGFEILLFTVFYPRGLQMGDHWEDGFAMTWNIASRTLFAVGIFLIIAPGLVGKLKTFSGFMSNYYFMLISRVSYSAYLVHLIILQIVLANTDQLIGLSQAYESSIAFSVAVLSLFSAAILYLAIEKPIINIETRMLNKKKPPINYHNQKDVKGKVV